MAEIAPTFKDFVEKSPENSICPLLKHICVKEKCRLWMVDDNSAVAECALILNTLCSSANVALLGQMLEHLGVIVGEEMAFQGEVDESGNEEKKDDGNIDAVPDIDTVPDLS